MILSWQRFMLVESDALGTRCFNCLLWLMPYMHVSHEMRHMCHTEIAKTKKSRILIGDSQNQGRRVQRPGQRDADDIGQEAGTSHRLASVLQH